MSEATPNIPPVEGVKDDVTFIRHSKAGYKTQEAIERSGNPRAAFNPEDQVTPDLTPEGREFAREKAEEFFDGLDPAQDKLFFVSSNEARALETGNAYREVAEARGFEIITPEKSGTRVAEEIGGGQIRTLNNLSLNSQDILLFCELRNAHGPRNGV